MLPALQSEEAPLDAEELPRRSPASRRQPAELYREVRMRMSPIQNVGTEKPKIESVMMALEAGLSGR
jgi:hypothetical protein